MEVNEFTSSLAINIQDASGVWDKDAAPDRTPKPKFGDKSITQNGEYHASDDDLTGYSSVDVSVSSGIPTDIQIDNIPEGYAQYWHIKFNQNGVYQCDIEHDTLLYYLFVYNAKRIDISAFEPYLEDMCGIDIYFTPDEDWDGIYYDGTKLDINTMLKPDVEFVPGSGTAYVFLRSYEGTFVLNEIEYSDIQYTYTD